MAAAARGKDLESQASSLCEMDSSSSEVNLDTFILN